MHRTVPYNPHQRSTAFTLIELLLVMVILAILAAVVVPHFAGTSERARVTGAKTDISNLKTALSAFEIDAGRYPTTEEGLNALVTRPADVTAWNGPYVEKVPKDPWGHEYVYRSPGSNGSDYDLLSVGPDGNEGTKDDIQ